MCELEPGMDDSPVNYVSVWNDDLGTFHIFDAKTAVEWFEGELEDLQDRDEGEEIAWKVVRMTEKAYSEIPEWDG